ncbi:molybdopterin-dependent oxidoreductase [Microbispora hainanensis]|uniref:Molybdopterin-dependent oxidoreductase n=2 Tax=Microbispora hainanensis TaxID=568844 RepID=A0A544YLG3_9ACTN|nr:molybdopterin-dependent oxidoreductase [Microbispora hainanensis]
MARRRRDRGGGGAGRPPELTAEAGCSRRAFIVGSMSGAAVPYLVAQAPATAAARDFVQAPGAPAPENNFVVQATPSWYFVQRENGSQEMKWGPVGYAVLHGEHVGYGELVPNDRMYIHNRARPPEIDRRIWRLKLTGDALTRPRSFTYEDLLAMPSVTLKRTIDCGANCAAFFPKLPPGGAGDRWLPVGYTQWHFGAVGAAEWTGVRAKDVLAAAGAETPVDVRFTGLDVIRNPSLPGGSVHYSQVAPAGKVLEDDTLLVYRMNGQDLPVDHGYPLRLLLSGWAAVSYVKWLGEIEVSKHRIPPSGLQTRHLLTGPAYPEPVPLTVGPVRSAIEHDREITLAPGDITLRGRAWSGAGAIERVDVSVEKLAAPGRWVTEMPWRTATLLSTAEPYMWVRFEVPWPGVKPGQYRVMSRARDKAGNVQPRPEDVVWNQHGLGYNGHHPLELIVAPPSDMP